jgi:hypothetical protein
MTTLFSREWCDSSDAFGRKIGLLAARSIAPDYVQIGCELAEEALERGDATRDSFGLG